VQTNVSLGLVRRGRNGMLTELATQVGPVVSEARTLDRFIAPAQERLYAAGNAICGWSWDHDTASLFRDLDPVRWRAAEPESGFVARRSLPLAKHGQAARRNWCCTAAH